MLKANNKDFKDGITYKSGNKKPFFDNKIV